MSALKCDICGGRLVMDDSREFAVCEFCGTKYLTSTLREKIQEIQGNVNLENSTHTKPEDFVIRGGVLEKYNGKSVDVVIPDKVLAIGKNAFSELQIHSVSMPDSVEEIRIGAFRQCGALNKIKMSNNLREIESYAFQECTNLEMVELPESIENLGFGVFAWCRNLKKINIPSKLKAIETETFKGCQRLEEIVIPSNIIRIGSEVFWGCDNLKEIVFESNNFSYVNFDSSLRNNVYTMDQGKRKSWSQIMREHGACQHCGGSFTGILIKKCSRCGKIKDY